VAAGEYPSIETHIHSKQLFVHHVLNMKTITISGDAHRRLESLKGGRSFSETIEGLIAENVESRTDRLLELGTARTGREGHQARDQGETVLKVIVDTSALIALRKEDSRVKKALVDRRGKVDAIGMSRLSEYELRVGAITSGGNTGMQGRRLGWRTH